MAANADGELVKLNAVVIKILAYCLAPLERGLDVAGVRRRNVHLFARKTRLQVFSSAFSIAFSAFAMPRTFA